MAAGSSSFQRLSSHIARRLSLLPSILPFSPAAIASGFSGTQFLPSSSSIGSMELMAVPKKKVSRFKKGLRNGPKALKPVPVIVRCKSCGRVKLPHFYCCSGDRASAGSQS